MPRYDARAAARRAFTELLGERPLDGFPAAVDDALASAVDALEQALGRTADWDQQLIARLH